MRFLFSRKSFGEFLNVPKFNIFSDLNVDSLGINKNLIKNLKKLKIDKLTEIQKIALGPILSGNDVIISSSTGSGKTLAYLLPIIESLLNKDSYLYKNEDGKFKRGAIILTPTKELCAQAYIEARNLSIGLGLSLSRTGSLTHISPLVDHLKPDQKVIEAGKAKRPEDLKLLSLENVKNSIIWGNMDILFSTPKQMDEILNSQKEKVMEKITPYYLVIDESDIIFRDVNFTMKLLKKFASRNTQLIMAGASKPQLQYKEDFKEFLKEYLQRDFIELETKDYCKIPEKISHDFIFVENEISNNPKLTKQRMLSKCIKESESESILVFFNDHENLETMQIYLESQNISCDSFTSRLQTEKRIEVLNRFSQSLIYFLIPESFRVLLTTELGCRGIDFKVSHVIEYEFAENAISLLHRMGRTGRLGTKGKVTSFITPEDSLLYTKYKETVDSNEKLEKIFSRKRSLNKSNK